MDDGSVRFCGWFPSTDDPPRRLKLRRYYGRGQLRRCNCFSSCICDLTLGRVRPLRMYSI